MALNLTLNQKLITFCAVFSALGHIIYSYGWDSSILGINMGYWFILNGAGYLLLLYFAYFGKQFQDKKVLIKYLLGGWAVGSIIAWALFHTASVRYTTLLDASLINKSVEVILLIFLYRDLRSTALIN